MNVTTTLVGQVLASRYKVLEELGSGGYATVYRVIDEETRQELALKCLHASSSRDSPRSTLFRHEYHTLAQLAHPRIVRVHDYGVCDRGAYYTMELVEGRDVREMAPLPAFEVCALLRDVASALAMLHARRLVHRDVSYRNVRCMPDGHAKLIDFGAMAAMGNPAQLIGTPPFTSPEALSCTGVDRRSDLYALGALAYWMLTEKHAYPAATFEMLRALWIAGAPPPPSKHAKETPPQLDRLVMSLLSLDPQLRPVSAAEVMDRLGAIADLPPAEDLRVAEAYLTKPVLVGRDRELSRIRPHLATGCTEHTALLIEGTEGLGKTRLLDELVMEAKLNGVATVSTAADASLGERYAVMRAIIEDVIARVPRARTAVSEQDRQLLAQEFRIFGSSSLAPAAAVPEVEFKHRLCGALMRWFHNLEDTSLLVAVDDFHLVDKDSAALIASLVADRSLNHLRLLLTALPEVPTDPPAVRVTRRSAHRIALGELDEQAASRLVVSVFGDVPRAGRVAHWIYERTQGNPLECMELAQYLVESGLIRYVEGTWMMPPSLPRTVPQGLRATRQARLETMASDQRILAEAIAIFGTAVPLDLCAPLAGLSEDETFYALDELIRLDLLRIQDGSYLLRAAALHAAIAESIPAERRAVLHERAGQLLRERGPRDIRTRILAGDHLMRGQSLLDGAEMIAAVARDPSVGRDVGEFFNAPLERALAVFEQHRRPPADTIPLRARLLDAAFMYDRSLVHHADVLLPQLQHDAGLDLLAAGSPRSGVAPRPRRAAPGDIEIDNDVAVDTDSENWLPKLLALAKQRHEACPNEQRGLPPEQALATLAAMAGVTLAASILQWDIPRIERLREITKPLSQLGSPSPLSAGPEIVALSLSGLRVGEASNHEERIAYLARLQDPQCYVGLAQARRMSITATQLHNIGMATSVLDGDTALRLADEIDSLGMQMYAGAAMQVRLMVHMYRGEAELARQCRERLDVLALQGGAGTHFELWLAPYLADPYALWGDVISLKRAAEHLARLGEREPGYAPMALIARGHYYRERGAHKAALLCFEQARARAPRDEHGSWLLALSGHADALVDAGQHQRARELIEELLGDLPYGPRFCLLIRQRMARTLALAEAHLGEVDRAKVRLEAAIGDELQLGKSPLHLGRLHEAMATVATLQKDREGFQAHVQKVGEFFTATENPILISRYDRLMEAGTSSGRRTGGTFPGRADHQSTVTDVQTVLSMLGRLEHAAARAQCGLDLLQEAVGADQAFLYLWRSHGLELAACTEGCQPPSELHGLLEQFTRDARRGDDVTRTAGQSSPAVTKTITCAQREFIPMLLTMDIDGTLEFMGAVAITLDARRPFVATRWELLANITRALYEVGDIVPARGLAGS